MKSFHSQNNCNTTMVRQFFLIEYKKLQRSLKTQGTGKEMIPVKKKYQMLSRNTSSNLLSGEKNIIMSFMLSKEQRS